jgi:uncharacterized peroxidase-related enzyme
MMPRIKALDLNEANEKARALLEGVKKKLGAVPNLMRTMAHSPAVLEAYLGFSSALGRGTLSARVREQIALAVGQVNSCDYCLAAHAALGRMAGLSDEEIADSRRGSSTDRKTEQALIFARKIVAERGHVSDGDIDQLHAAGFTDDEITEIIANVALNIFTNYLNHIAGTEVDFPEVKKLETAPSCAC